MAEPALSFREHLYRREEEDFRERESFRLVMLEKARAAVARLAPRFPSVEGVSLFGSVLQPGRFTHRSDIDIAVDCTDLEEESRFWRALEADLEWDVDLRPRKGAVARAVEAHGEHCHAGKIHRP